MTLISDRLQNCVDLISFIDPSKHHSKVLYVDDNQIKISNRFPSPPKCKIITTLSTLVIRRGLTATQWSVIHLKLIQFIKEGVLK